MKAGLREVRAGHEHEFEAEPGLPEALPRGERVLWQGRPDWRALAVDAFHVRVIAAYFVMLVGLSVALRLADGAPVAEAARAGLWLGLLFGFAWGMLVLLAWMSARSAMYTLTENRIVMRVGIVLTLTFNLPLRRIGSAGLRLRKDGHTGDIPLQVLPPDRIAIVHLWPHARPWRLSSPEPMLRCVPDAAAVAQALRGAWAASTQQNVSAAPVAAASPVAAQPRGQHALA